jgi:N-acetylglucosaminyldiphosphoundecaprenol N-acetyl-beta-D-mannosaminyltransferase
VIEPAAHAQMRNGSLSRFELIGAPIDPLTLAECVELVAHSIASNDHCEHGSINASKLVQLQTDQALRDALWNCKLATADGQPVVWAARLLGHKIPERVAGIDLMEGLLESAEKVGHRIYLLGARSEALAGAEAVIKQRHPNIKIVGSRDGYFSPDEEPQVVSAIARSNPDLLFVALESPKKELFLARNRSILSARFAMGVGGAFDVLAGVKTRAPKWAQKAGLEWVFRLGQDPRRLGRRYLIGNARFLELVIGTWVRTRLRGSDR